MHNILTKKQREVLEIIENLMNAKGFAPTVREIRDAVHLASVSTVYTHMEKLKEKGYITWEPSQPRTLRILKTAS
ncbi:LexA family protein [Bacillus benzoevorans]|uniref:Repressor LexA n=1 Tax=Bacillus benzoevorans TaxID=1456 RepID=A0A7X0HTA0_9BACI|nr:HTH domain-containing protein [Bacillus benzoevorans]MBB6446430.1 repressor LexA [Bacillus benzoevorans]